VLAALVREGIVEAAAACDGQVTLSDASRSNPVFVVSVDGDPKHVVKQAGPLVESDSSVESEAAAYRWLATEPSLAGVAPRAIVLTTATGSSWLVLDAVPDARPLHTLPARDVGVLLGELAHILAGLHTASAASGHAESMLGARRPWVLQLVSCVRPDFAVSNPAAGAALAGVQEDPDLMTLVRNAERAWWPTSAIHGDVKWDNVLVGTHHGGPKLWLIDWELAAWGDPLWDLASVVESLLTPAIVADEAADLAAARTVVSAYGPADPQRLVRLLSARLVQVAVQVAGMTGEHDSEPGRRLLRLARALAADPATWIGELCA
jgi:aminoglycoside phosphotransferase (APT) family kinase protein